MGTTLRRTIFEIPGMDCGSEENLVRMKLDPFQEVLRLEFDLDQRQVTVFHEGPTDPLEAAVRKLGLGCKLRGTEPVDAVPASREVQHRRVLRAVLIINFVFFLLESAAGWLSDSMGLVADSLDMLADSLVYGLSLMAVGATITRKKRVARWAGYLQIVLALLGLTEVIRRYFGAEALPDFGMMIGVSVLALLANGICLYLLRRAGSGEAHMRASAIFTSNDIIINLGVITAGLSVWATGSYLPDLIAGLIVFMLVLNGARRILALSK